MIWPFFVKHIKTIVVCALLFFAAALLALGPRADEGVPAGRTVIEYWEKWNGDEEAQMRQIVDEFNNTVGAQKNIYVRFVSTSLINQKALVATAGGVPPDVAGLWDVNMVQFAALDALEPLEDMAKEYGINSSTYKPVYWNAVNWNGHLYALISTPSSTALHYNKRIFQESAGKLRAAGLDPDQAPQTLDELDRYSAALDEIGPNGRIIRAGSLPLEPGWFTDYMYMWYGADIWDAKNQKFTLTDPGVVKSFAWIQSYSKRLGKDATNEFQNAVGTFDSPQNSFLVGSVVMELQGPWMANYILNQKPSMDGCATRYDDNINEPLEERLKRMEWAVAPFPSAVPGMKDVAYCGFDTLVIPKGCKHKEEAFAFIAYVNRQEVMEKLCNLHSKNSPLAKVSENFLEHHKNPYIKVFEELANSPNAQTIPKIPILPEVVSELDNVKQELALLHGTPEEALAEAQRRLEKKWAMFQDKQRARYANGSHAD